jgi:hypothetical protein
MIPRPLILALCRSYPRHILVFRHAPTLYVVVNYDRSVACGEVEKDRMVLDAVAAGLPVLIVEAINENTPAK